MKKGFLILLLLAAATSSGQDSLNLDFEKVDTAKDQIGFKVLKAGFLHSENSLGNPIGPML